MAPAVIEGGHNEHAAKFYHPYAPYSIQKEFMARLYETLESKKVGIFESPTGTGKTLSLICPSLTWLRNSEARALEAELKALDTADGPEWTKVSAKEILLEQSKERGKLVREVTKRALQAQKELRLKSKSLNRKAKFARIAAEKKTQAPPNQTAGSDYLLSDNPAHTEAESLLHQLEASDDPLQALKTPVKIFFTSRTHSQLSQLVGSLKLLQVPASWSDEQFESVKHVSLGSRKHLCINESVNKLSNSQINDKCLEMQKSAHKCKFKKSIDDPETQSFRDQTLSTIMDIEDLHELGSQLRICPYYASRDAVAYSEVVTLPYQLLFQKSAREALGIDLKDSVVIIDEAHNILDVIGSLYSEHMSHKEVTLALEGLRRYFQRVGSRLSSRNRILVAKTIKVVEALASFFEMASKLSPKQNAPGIRVDRASLFASNNADLANMFELEEFLKDSKLAFKVDSYLRDQEDMKSSRGLVLSKIVNFLTLSIDPLAEGKLFFDRNENQELVVKYLLLDPSNQFVDVVESAKCVVLAGGTMEPTSYYVQQLFPYLTEQQVELFSCGHLIPKQNLMVQPVSFGPTRQEFEFTFARRNDPKMIADLGAMLLTIFKAVPAGLVVFFPSYAYLALVAKLWKQNGMLGQLSSVKQIFTEEKAVSAEQLLAKYAGVIDRKMGAAILAVVGGKLSEGINFSDDLARAVVMVGLPFPNAFSAEVVAKKDHIENRARQSGKSDTEAKQQARDYYENLSMRAVNQSIGRAIRHIKDYAAIFLLDRRYASPLIQRKLSAWIRKGISPENQAKHSASHITIAAGATSFFQVPR